MNKNWLKIKVDEAFVFTQQHRIVNYICIGFLNVLRCVRSQPKQFYFNQ